MTSVHEKIQFLIDLKNNRKDFQDNYSIELANSMKNYRLWFTDKEFEKASGWDKIVYFFRPIFLLVCILPVSIYLVLHLDEGSLDQTTKKIAYNLAVYLGLVLQAQSIVYRAEASQLLIIVNEISKNNLRKWNHLKFRSRRNLIYIAAFILPQTVVVLLFVPIPILVETFRSGELYFKHDLPFAKDPFNWGNYIQAFLYYFLFMFNFLFCMAYLAIICESFLQIVLNYSILADDLRALRNGKMLFEQMEYQKLRTAIIEFNHLKRALDLANVVAYPFFMAFVSLIFVHIGLSLALIFSTESKWELLINSIYPAYLYFFMSSLCLIGQSLIISSDALRYAIYECNWYDAPIRFRKMVILFQIQCERPLMVDLKPFWVLNMELLLRIVKNSYIIIAIVRKMSTPQ